MVRGRPREFDPDSALDRVLPVFWRDGFEGASVQALCEAAGVSKPSLYAAYGNKEALYLAALRRYADREGAVRIAALHATPDARQAVRTFLHSLVALYTDPGEPGGCLIASGASASASAAMPAAVRCALVSALQGITDALATRLERARQNGELPTEADPLALAQFFGTIVTGLSVQARSQACATVLTSVVESAMQVFPAPAGAVESSDERRDEL